MNRFVRITFCVSSLACVFGVAGDASPAAPTPSTFTLWQLPNQTGTQMMSYVVRTAGGKVIVIDGGTAGDAAYLKKFLVDQGGVVEAWFVSHSHSDHVGALPKILAHPEPLKIKTFYAALPDEAWVAAHASKEELHTFQAFRKALRAANRTVTELKLDQDFRIDGVRIEVLGVPNPKIHPNAINNSSLAWRFSDADKSVLFLGDLGVQGGAKLLKRAPAARLKSDYVQMAHHGQHGVSEAFYKAVAPSYCLWPTPDWLWDNNKGGGKGSGPWDTLNVRAWMDKLNIKRHYVMKDGLHKID